MAKDKDETVNEEQSTPEIAENKYQLNHLGFGRYEVNGEKFPTKADAEAYVLRMQRQDSLDEVIGDKLPEGYEMTVRDQPHVYRGSLMELAMNEPYAPDGSFNKHYDREWEWSFAAYNQVDISTKRAAGYQLVDFPTLEKGVKEDRYPPHLLSMFREEGSYLVYGDSVLVRIPRVIRRQQRAAREQDVLKRMKNLQRDQNDQFNSMGVGIKEDLPVSNDLTIRL